VHTRPAFLCPPCHVCVCVYHAIACIYVYAYYCHTVYICTFIPPPHRLSEHVIIERLLAMGILTGGTVADMEAVHMGAVFMPHGLGHFMGMNVHDVGGYNAGCPERESAPGVCYLRTSRVLEAGMVGFYLCVCVYVWLWL
jgi:hypothetical protein